jgi:hypothetical protein
MKRKQEASKNKDTQKTTWILDPTGGKGIIQTYYSKQLLLSCFI